MQIYESKSWNLLLLFREEQVGRAHCPHKAGRRGLRFSGEINGVGGFACRYRAAYKIAFAEPAAVPVAKCFHCERTEPASPTQRMNRLDSYRVATAALAVSRRRSQRFRSAHCT